MLKPHRHDIVLASKFGIEFDLTSPKLPHPLVANADPKKIKSALGGSMQRLHTDYLDLYYQHRPDPSVIYKTFDPPLAEENTTGDDGFI